MWYMVMESESGLTRIRINDIGYERGRTGEKKK